MSPPKSPSRNATIFFADTPFERMARRNGGMTRDEAVKSAQAQLEEMKFEFEPWLESQLQDLRTALTGHKDGSSYVLTMQSGQRICVEVQDVGTTMGFALVTFVANALYEILETVKAGAPYDKDMVDCHVDALFFVTREPYRNMSPEDVPELSSGLRRLADIASISPDRDPPAKT